MKVWIDDWRAELQGEEFHLQAKDGGLGLDLVLKPLKPPALHGQGGYSRKSGTSDAASYYYSLPRLSTRGTIFVDGRQLAVTGESWMDHEFFTGAMAPDLAGWDWFSLQLEDGWEVMLYLLRQKDGSVDPASSGSLIDPPGQRPPPEPRRLYGQAHRHLDLPPHPGQIPGGLGDHYPRGRLPSEAHPDGARPGDPFPGPGEGDLLGRGGQNRGGEKRRPGGRPGLRRTHRLRRRDGWQVLKRGKRRKGKALGE